MTNKQTIDGVSRELLEEMLAAMKETHSLPAKFYGSTLGDRVRAILQSQNDQSDPLPIGTLHRDCDERIVFESLGEIHIKDGMYVYAEPAAQPQGEVESLRRLAEDSCNELIKRCLEHSDQLAERDALLREALCHAQRIEPMSISLFNRIDAALSTSAEPTKQEPWALQVEKDLGIERLPAEPKPRGEAGTASVEDGSIVKAALSATKEG